VGEKEKTDITWTRVRYNQMTTEISLNQILVLAVLISEPSHFRVQQSHEFFIQSSFQLFKKC
jgi:hypothetical protein